MEENKKEQTVPTPKQRMNVWVSDQIDAIAGLIEQTRGVRTEEHESYLRGSLAGIRMLQDAWLAGKFDA